MFGRSEKAKKGSSDKSNADLFHGLKRGTGQPPLAALQRFPTAAEIADHPDLRFDISNPDGKVFLGLVGAEMRERNGTRYASGGQLVGIQNDMHQVLVAGSRSGKSRSILLNNLFCWPGSVLVIDPKLDLASETARFRAEVLGHKVFILDPFCAAESSVDAYRTTFNPLDLRLGSDPDDLIDIAMLIADSLVVRSGERDPHWNDASQQMIESVILHVLTSPQYETNRTLNMVYWLLMTKAEDGGEEQPSTLEAEMVSNGVFGGIVAAGATAFYDKEHRERSAVLSTIRRHLHFLTYPKIGRVLESGPVDLAAIQTEPMTIYVGVPATKMSSCAGWLRLFINLSLATFEANKNRRDHQHQTGRPPVLLMMDEFASLGRMQRVEAAAGQIAGLGCKLFPVLQDLSQLKAMTPLWETFLGNAGVLSFFGNSDLTTLEWLEKRLGQTTVYSPSHSDPTYDAAVSGGVTGAGYSLSTHPLMTVAEIARTFGRDDPFHRQLVILPSRGPMILQRAFYDQHEAFRGLRESGP